jgi:hypothetical protein
MASFIPLKNKNKKAEDLAEVLIQEMWKLNTIPANIIYEWDSRFKSKSW